MSIPFWVWFFSLERRMVSSLLRSPLFHRGVGRIHKAVHEFRYGKLPEDMGGTKIDNPRGGVKRFAQLFMEELKNGHRPEPKIKK